MAMSDNHMADTIMVMATMVLDRMITVMIRKRTMPTMVITVIIATLNLFGNHGPTSYMLGSLHQTPQFGKQSVVSASPRT